MNKQLLPVRNVALPGISGALFANVKTDYSHSSDFKKISGPFRSQSAGAGRILKEWQMVLNGPRSPTETADVC